MSYYGGYALLNPLGTPCPRFWPLNFILRSDTTISTPLPHLIFYIRHSSVPDGAPRFPPKSSYLPFKSHFDSPLANLNSILLDITN
jgi:hypothetical protein